MRVEINYDGEKPEVRLTAETPDEQMQLDLLDGFDDIKFTWFKDVKEQVG